jgi:hypothetical protein
LEGSVRAKVAGFLSGSASQVGDAGYLGLRDRERKQVDVTGRAEGGWSRRRLTGVDFGPLDDATVG